MIIWFPANATFDTVQSCAVGAVSLDDAVGQQGLCFSSVSRKLCRKLGNESACYEDLKGAGAAPTTKPGLAGRGMVLLLDVFRAGEGLFLAAFLVFAGNWPPYLYSTFTPAFWETSLRAGRNCCLSKAVLLCGGVIIIPHLAFLMRSCVLGCKDVHKARFPCLSLQWSLAPVWGVCFWFSGEIFRNLLFETGDHLAFCLVAFETVNRPAEEQIQRSCVPECCFAVLRLPGHWLCERGCWEKVLLQWASAWWWLYQLLMPPFPSSELFLGSLKSCLGGQRGELEGSCSPWELWLCCSTQQGWGWGQPAALQEKTDWWSKEEILQGFLPVWETQFKCWVCSLACSLVLGCAQQGGAGLCDNQSIPCCGITPSPLPWNIGVRCHVKGMDIHL